MPPVVLLFLAGIWRGNPASDRPPETPLGYGLGGRQDNPLSVLEHKGQLAAREIGNLD